ncbi:hypothetical protein LJC15_04730 [Desulfovibrio sp. OttesenSCG-928-G11]|nr:hypothetical protein [Desulfovibrio sp. OttesenSCG-928-G11]
MRRDDLAAGAAIGLGIALFAIPAFMNGFSALTASHPYAMSFVKFALLATFGECLGLRIATGVYNRPGFGILPRALVWGFLGMGIKLAFTIFVSGVPVAMRELGLAVPDQVLSQGPFAWTLLTSFCISLGLNCIFAPLFMTLHRVTDAHILATGGSLRGFFSPIEAGRLLQEVNWTSLWGFVFKKTIPFFWIPAHSITFILPQHFQVLFAALLGVVLGLILAVASRK